MNLTFKRNEGLITGTDKQISIKKNTPNSITLSLTSTETTKKIYNQQIFLSFYY